jgi:hypothetical protein
MVNGHDIKTVGGIGYGGQRLYVVPSEDFMGNSYQKRDAYYGAFQGNFLRRIAALFPDRRHVLRVFAGRVDLAAFPGDTLDCNPALAPTWCCNAETCDGVPLHQYDFALADPPGRGVHRLAGSGLADVSQDGAEDRSGDRHRRLDQSPVPGADGVPQSLTLNGVALDAQDYFHASNAFTQN